MSKDRIVLEIKNESGELIESVEFSEKLSQDMIDLYNDSDSDDEEEFFSNLLKEALKIFQDSGN